MFPRFMLYLPVAQETQAACPNCGLYVPALQLSQVLAAVAAVAALNLPAAQLVQSASVS